MITTSQKAYVAVERYLYRKRDSSVNDEIGQASSPATSSLLERNDVTDSFCLLYLRFVLPKEYADSAVSLRPGLRFLVINCSPSWWMSSLERNDTDSFNVGKFRVRGDVVEIFPASRDEHAFGLSFSTKLSGFRD